MSIYSLVNMEKLIELWRVNLCSTTSWLQNLYSFSSSGLATSMPIKVKGDFPGLGYWKTGQSSSSSFTSVVSQNSSSTILCGGSFLKMTYNSCAHLTSSFLTLLAVHHLSCMLRDKDQGPNYVLQTFTVVHLFDSGALRHRSSGRWGARFVV